MDNNVSLENLVDENNKLRKQLEDSAEVIKYQMEWIKCLESESNPDKDFRKEQVITDIERLAKELMNQCRNSMYRVGVM